MSRYVLPTQINWSRGFAEVPNYINIVAGSTIMNLLIVAIFFIFASGYYIVRRDLFASFAVGGFISWVLCLILWLGSMVSGVAFGVSTAVMILGFASLWINRAD